MKSEEITLFELTAPLSQKEDEWANNVVNMFSGTIQLAKDLKNYLYHLILVYVLIQFREKSLIGKGGHNNV